MSAEAPDRAAVHMPEDGCLDEPCHWSAIQLIGSELFSLCGGAEVVAHLWRLLGALR